MKNNILAGIYTLLILSGLSTMFYLIMEVEWMQIYVLYTCIAIFGVFWVVHPLWDNIRIKLEQKDLDEFKED